MDSYFTSYINNIDIDMAVRSASCLLLHVSDRLIPAHLPPKHLEGVARHEHCLS